MIFKMLKNKEQFKFISITQTFSTKKEIYKKHANSN